MKHHKSVTLSDFDFSDLNIEIPVTDRKKSVTLPYTTKFIPFQIVGKCSGMIFPLPDSQVGQ